MTWRNVLKHHKILRDVQEASSRVPNEYLPSSEGHALLRGGCDDRFSALWTRTALSQSCSGQAIGWVELTHLIFWGLRRQRTRGRSIAIVEFMKEPTREHSYSTELQARMRRQAVRLGGIVVTILILSLLVPLFIKTAVRYFL
jgi:hypothetical protein